MFGPFPVNGRRRSVDRREVFSIDTSCHGGAGRLCGNGNGPARLSASCGGADIRRRIRPKNLTPVANDPIGSIDEVSSPRAGVVRIRGWALDRDSAGDSIQVHAYVGGQAGAPNTDGINVGEGWTNPQVGCKTVTIK